MFFETLGESNSVHTAPAALYGAIRRYTALNQRLRPTHRFHSPVLPSPYCIPAPDHRPFVSVFAPQRKQQRKQQRRQKHIPSRQEELETPAGATAGQQQ